MFLSGSRKDDDRIAIPVSSLPRLVSEKNVHDSLLPRKIVKHDSLEGDLVGNEPTNHNRHI